MNGDVRPMTDGEYKKWKQQQEAKLDVFEQKTDKFQKELEELINKHSKENGSNTPDFILAKYLDNCLNNFNKTSRAREKWFGKSLEI